VGENGNGDGTVSKCLGSLEVVDGFLSCVGLTDMECLFIWLMFVLLAFIIFTRSLLFSICKMCSKIEAETFFTVVKVSGYL